MLELDGGVVGDRLQRDVRGPPVGLLGIIGHVPYVSGITGGLLDRSTPAYDPIKNAFQTRALPNFIREAAQHLDRMPNTSIFSTRKEDYIRRAPTWLQGGIPWLRQQVPEPPAPRHH